MTGRYSKRDRTARLLNVMHILYQNPQGLMVKEVADNCGISKRTAYRDLIALEEELQYPIWEDNQGKRGIDKDYFLPPIYFSLNEAMTIFLAARLMLSYTHKYDPNIASTFLRLNSIVPPPLREQVQKTIDWMQNHKRDEKYIRILETLTEALIKQHTVRIWYKTSGEAKERLRDIDPYFIEPAAASHSSYVIAHCHHAGELRTFKIERIRKTELSADSYSIPDGFDANSYFASSWGIVVNGVAETIKLSFDPEVAMILEEVLWHPSQVIKKQPDGSVVLTLTVQNTVELQAWILGWGGKVEVLEPMGLRKEIAESAKAILLRHK